MEYKFSQNQKFLQRMALTPQMRQSIQLLGMSATDLSEYIDSVIAQNPFIKKLISAKASEKYRRSGTVSDEPGYAREGASRQPSDPRLTLLSQARMSGLKGKELEIAEYLIYEMDENGYIDCGAEEVAEDLGVAPEDVERCLKLIQRLDPPGIGARDIRECLQLQLKRKNKEDSLEYRIVTSFLNEVARNEIQSLVKALKADKEDIEEAFLNIKKLNPRPASSMLARDVDPAIPELIAKVDSDKVRLELNRDRLPNLKLYNPYEHNFDIIKDPEARKFMKENMDAAKTLVDNLRRREETVCKVADFILKFQQDPLAKDGALNSLTIKDVAKALRLHPSTISRAISNKFIQINDEVKPLKNFLSHSVKKENGEFASKASIKGKIAEFIGKEDRKKPLADIEVQNMLELEGFVIKRRTVAKYRESLKILPSHLRKRV